MIPSTTQDLKKNKKVKYIVYVGSIEPWRKELEAYVISKNLSWKFISLVSSSLKTSLLPETDLFKQVAVNFSNEAELKEFVEALGDSLLTVVNRGERNIPHFQKLIPHLPERILVPSVEALIKSTEKPKMRKAFWKYDKSMTPKFEILTEVHDEAIQKIIKRLEFPVIVKPSGLAQAVLVQAAHYPEELAHVLKSISRKMKKSYHDMKGRGAPEIIVEEIINGAQYSVDALVNSKGQVFFCPFIKYITSGEKGFDDFFSYEQSTPATISKESLHKAKEVATKGIHALGLRNSVAHIELIRRDGSWYIVEIGPRIGGFRSMMYMKSFGINLDIQDIRNHLGLTPKLPRVKKGYTSVIKFFPKKEGVITKITGIKKAKELPSFFDIQKKAKTGDKALFAKNGGTCLFYITLFHEDKSQFIADKRKLEKMICIETKSLRKIKG